MGEVNKEDLWDVRNTIHSVLKDGFSSINARLDSLDLRQRKLEERTSVHSWAIGLVGTAGLALFAWLLSRVP
jgi:hypothetical protein